MWKGGREGGFSLHFKLCGIRFKHEKQFTMFCFLRGVHLNEAVCCMLQLYVLKPEEGGGKTPIANYFTEHVFSLTWDCGAMLKIKGKDFIMPGEVSE